MAPSLVRCSPASGAGSVRPRLERHGAAPGHLEDLEPLERADAGQHEGLGAGQLDDHGLGVVVHHRGVVELHHVEQLAVPIARWRAP